MVAEPWRYLFFQLDHSSWSYRSFEQEIFEALILRFCFLDRSHLVKYSISFLWWRNDSEDCIAIAPIIKLNSDGQIRFQPSMIHSFDRGNTRNQNHYFTSTAPCRKNNRAPRLPRDQNRPTCLIINGHHLNWMRSIIFEPHFDWTPRSKEVSPVIWWCWWPLLILTLDFCDSFDSDHEWCLSTAIHGSDQANDLPSDISA